MKHNEAITKLLKEHRLKRTSTRSEILNLYYESKHALAHKDIELELSEKFDRVTIYRTLNTFEEKGIIHKIFDGSASVKYALCGTECHDLHEHHHNHIHFTCNKCEKTFCIEEIAAPKIKMPRNFKAENVYLVAKGLCDNCNS